MSDSAADPVRPERLRRLPLKTAVVTAAVLAAFGSGFGTGWLVREPRLPAFRKLTHGRGTVHAARFCGSGREVVFSAAWDGGAPRVSWLDLDSGTLRTLPVPGARLAAAGTRGLVAVLEPAGPRDGGVLVRLDGPEGAGRTIARGVLAADFVPGGAALVAVRGDGARQVLEFPVGRPVYATAGWIGELRVSPGGSEVAFASHPEAGDEGGTVAIVDRAGQLLALTPAFASVRGLAWAPSGQEVLFTAGEPEARSLRSVSRGRRLRELLRAPGSLVLHDVASDGSLLVSVEEPRTRTFVKRPAEAREREVPLPPGAVVAALSADGSRLLASGSLAGREGPLTFARCDGSPATRLGRGVAGGLSPDALWLLAFARRPFERFQLASTTGAQAARTLRVWSLGRLRPLGVLPDLRRIAFSGAKPGRPPRGWVVGIDGGEPLPVTPEGLDLVPGGLAPDGTALAGTDAGGHLVVVPLGRGDAAPRRIPRCEPWERPAGWRRDARLAVWSPGGPTTTLTLVDVASGARIRLGELAPPDLAGTEEVAGVVAALDGTVAFTVRVRLGELHLVESF